MTTGGKVDELVGKTYPYVVVVSSDQNERYLSMGFKGMNSNSFRDARKLVKRVAEGDETVEAMTTPQFWYAKNMQGGYEFNFMALEDGNVVTLQSSEKSRPYKIPLDKLTSGCTRYAKYRAGQGEVQDDSPKVYELENWSNNEGAIISAKFIQLEGQNITLELEGGKESTFSVDLLSEDSKKKALEYSQE